MKTRPYYRVLVLFVVIQILFSVSAASGRFSLQVDTDDSARQLPWNLVEITNRVIQDELGWHYHFDAGAPQMFSVIVENIRIDSNSFTNRFLVQMDFIFSWADSQIDQTLAFLVDNLDMSAQVYAEHLSKMVRANGVVLTLPEENDVIISQVHKTGYWTTYAAEPLPVGARYRVFSVDNSAVALLEVADSFNFPDTERDIQVTELVPLWSRRTLVEGMSLTRVKPNLTLTLSTPLSLNRVGFVLGSSLPILATQYKFLVKIGAAYVLSDSAYEIMVHAGISRRVSLGNLFAATDDQGSWWSNIQLGAQASLAAGLLVTETGATRFLYGAEVGLEIVHQTLAHWYWGVAVGYIYTTAVHDGMFIPIQNNVDGIILSPTFGWMW